MTTTSKTRSERGLAGAVSRHPVLSFWLVAVAIEILIVPAFLLSGAQAGLDRAITVSGVEPNTDLVSATRLVLAEPAALLGVMFAIAQVAAPDLAVLAVRLLSRGGIQITDVYRRFRFWSPSVGVRRGLRLWLVVIVLFSGMNLASAGLHALLLGPEGDFTWNVAPPVLPLVLGLVVAMFLDGGAVFEENGWRGFALPRLQQRHNPLRASMVLGVMWALWHLPVKFELIDYGLLGAGAIALVLMIKFVLLSIIMTHFTNSAGGATILAIAMHGLSNDSVRIGGYVDAQTTLTYLLSEINLILPLLVVAVVLVIVTRGRLGVANDQDSRPPRPTPTHVGVSLP